MRRGLQPIMALAALASTAAAPVAPPAGPAPGATEPATPPAAAPAVPPAPLSDAAPPRLPARVSGLPSFAPQLSDLPPITGPSGWTRAGKDGGWAGIIASRPATRQAARWAYATHELTLGRSAEALGALEVMGQDDPDLSLVPSYQLALGTVLAQLNRPSAATTALAGEALQANPEACVWRMMALLRAQLAPQALQQLQCALPALNARPVPARAPFLIAAAHAAADLGRPAFAKQLVAVMPATDPAANLIRGRAEIALGNRPLGRLLLARVGPRGDIEQRLDAELSGIEDRAGQAPLSASDFKRLQQIRFIWRGGDIELRALRLSYGEARRRHDVRGTLDAGATLFRYFSGGPDRSALVTQLQDLLAATLAPENPMPLEQVAGLYWDYRDLSPAGAAGDLLVTRLADRLQAAGLYERAAELLDHQLRIRTIDIAQGPLSARVASLFILAGQPKRALSAIRDTEGNNYPDEMLWARHRVEAVALDQLGRTNEALAVLQDVPDGDAIRGEINWRRHDWQALAAAPPPKTGPSALTDVAQARILRLAVAYAMLGRESDLAALATRYGAAFAGLPTAGAFASLTASVDSIDPSTISAAMAAIPAASPAGSIGDLIDAAPQAAH